MKFYLFLFTIVFTQTSLLMGAETEFEKLLEKNASYKKIVSNIDNTASDASTRENLKTVESAIDTYIEERKQPKIPSHAELQAEAEMDMERCSTCQNYLNLSGDINKVLSKMDLGSDVGASNTVKLQLNHLSFLYYVVKYDHSMGSISCSKFGDIKKVSTKFDGNLRLMAEEVFDLPNVNEVQYIPENAKEIVYLYRGVGKDSNKVYEVHILPNKRALIRFYDYTPSSAELQAIEDAKSLDRMLSLVAKKDQKQEVQKDNFIKLGVDLKTRDKIIPTDLEVLNAGTKAEIAPELVLGTKTKVSFNEQVTEVSLANNSGEAYLMVNAKNKTEGKSEFVTIIPMSIKLDEDSKLNLNGSLKSEVGVAHGVGLVDNAQTIDLNLTDHNHKYIGVELYQKPAEDYSKVSLSNSYNLGDNNSISMNVSQDNKGDRTFSIGKNTNLGNYGTLKTEFGGGTTSKHFVAVQHEVAIGKVTTLSLGARAEDGKQYSTMFQLKTRW